LLLFLLADDTSGELLPPPWSFILTPIEALSMEKTDVSNLWHEEFKSVQISGLLTLNDSRQVRPLLRPEQPSPLGSRPPIIGMYVSSLSGSLDFLRACNGRWIYGVRMLSDQFLWTNCLRFLYNSSIDRVTVASHTFLVLFFDTVNQTAKFFECRANV